MADDKITLIYFNYRGCAEAVRYMFAYKGVDYVDRRISQDDWAALKSSMPTETLPVLTRNDRRLSQSNTIARFVGRMNGLSGKDEWEQAFLDSIVDLCTEIVEEAGRNFYLKTQEEEAKLQEKLVKDILPQKVALLVRLMNTSASRPFILGDKPTWADFVVAASMDGFDYCLKGQLRGVNAEIKEHQLRIEALPAVKAWIDKRPKSDF